MQGDPFTSGHAQGPKRPSIKTGLKHPSKVSANKAYRKNTEFSGPAYASPEVCLAPLARGGWSRGTGLPNCLSCRAHGGNKWQKQCPSGFFPFSAYFGVTVHVTLWYWVIYHHWVPRLAPLEKNQRKQQGLGFDEEETNYSLQEHANFSATPCTPTHTIPGCSFPLPAAPPHASLLLSLFSAQTQCLVSMDFCVNSLKDIHWNGHIYRITNVLKAGGAIIVIQKPPIFGALCCHPVRLCFALPGYCTSFSTPLLWAAPVPALSAEAW